MKKLKNFQKFALSAERANAVRGGAVDWADDPQTSWTCHYGQNRTVTFNSLKKALAWCSKSTNTCSGCF